MLVANEPIIFRQLRLLSRYCVKEVAVFAGFLADVLREKIQPEADKLGIKLSFFVEDKPLGTAGGLTAAKNFLWGNYFFVLYADVVVEMDLTRILDFHRDKGATVTVIAHPNDHPHESDLLKTDENGRILEILPRKKRVPGFYRNLVPAAVYCFSSGVFDYIEPGIEQDFISDVFPRMINNGCSVYAYNTPEYLRDMGTVGRYEMVNEDIKSGLVERMNFSVKRPAVFFDRDGVLTYDPENKGAVNYHKLELIKGAAKAIRLINDAGWLAIVITNQPHIAKGFITLEQLNFIHAKLETLLGYEHAKLDRIYFCPHHTERGFEGEVRELKIECDCRKPKAGMLWRATEELPILGDDSYVIGDSWRDIGAAREAGLYAYGVRTGIGCRDCKGAYRPDLIFSNVLEVVKFTLFGVLAANVIADKIVEQFLQKNKIFIVGICGIARSGKSTFAHALSKELKKRNMAVLHVRLDDWILPFSRRDSHSTAEERQQIWLYPKLLNALVEGEELIAPGYDPATRGISGGVVYKLSGEQVILLDGLFACHKSIRNKLDYAIYVEAEEKLLTHRFYEFYQWKGQSEEKIERMLRQRKKDEWKAVMKQRDFVDEEVRITKKEI